MDIRFFVINVDVGISVFSIMIVMIVVVVVVVVVGRDVCDWPR